jgi:hypothetical protein
MQRVLLPQYRSTAAAKVGRSTTTRHGVRRFVRTAAPGCSQDLVDASHAPIDFDIDSAVVYRDFIHPEESEVLLADLYRKLKR